MTILRLFVLTLALTVAGAADADDAIRIKDIGKVSGWRENALTVMPA